MKIAVDFDDILLDCNSSLALFHNNRYGTSYCRDDIRSWHLEKTWGCTYEEMVKRVNEWYFSDEHGGSVPMPGSQEAVVSLARNHELHIVTSRPEQIRDRTEEWLRRHFPKMFSGTHFTGHFWNGAKNKSDVCRQLGVALLIEDSPLHAQNVASAHIPVLLMDSPWNQELDADGQKIIRIKKWQDVLDFVSSLTPT